MRNPFKLSVLFILALLLSAQMPALAEFDLPASTVVIQERAFENVPLSDVTVDLPEGLQRIEARAFAGTGITKIYIPQSVTFIAPDAFDLGGDFHPIVESGSYAKEWCNENGVTPYTITGLGAASRSQSAIRSFIAEHPSSTSGLPEFRQAPTGGAYGGDEYNYGLLTEESLNNAINMVNQVRYIAGLNADVVNASNREAALAASALVNGLNGTISHSPSRPTALQDAKYDELFALAQQGASSSNLFAGVSNLAASVLGYMDDSDSSNIPMVRHRRWIINPSMSRTTFGFYQSNSGYRYYSGMYSFDMSGSGSQSPVAWPAQQTPISYFGYNRGRNNCAWSVSFGRYVDPAAVEVTLVNTKTRQQWHFSSAAADGYFNVNNVGYGQTGCVIFRPDGISISAGDTYQVTVTNSANYTILRYSVTFFSL